MMRGVKISASVTNKLDEISEYLKNDLKFSEYAVTRHRRRIVDFIRSLENPGDYARCRNRRWHDLGYRCATVQGWVVAYEIVEGGVIVRDMVHSKLIRDVVD